MSFSSLKTQPPKFIFIGGKGGVGKTTISSAIGYLLSTNSTSTVLLASLDPAHSLSDTFHQPLTNNVPHRITPTLKIVEISLKEITASLDHEYLRTISNIPGIAEALAISTICEHYDKSEEHTIKTIIIDTSANAFIKALNFPTLLNTLLNKKKKYHSILQPYKIYAEIQKSATHITHIKKNATFILTLTPDHLSIYNTKKDIDILSMHDIETEAIVINKILDTTHSSKSCTNCSTTDKIQNKYIQAINNIFKDIDIIKIYKINTENMTIEDIKNISNQIQFNK